jgi:hypothetical protein
MNINIVLALALFASAARAEPTIAMQWKARGLEAMEKIERLNKQSKLTKPGSRQAAVIASQLQLEWAFVVFVDPRTEPKAHYTEKGNREVFHLVMNSGESMFDLMFIYANGKMIGSRLDHLPAGWQVFVPSDLITHMLVMREGASPIAIDLSAPLESVVPEEPK